MAAPTVLLPNVHGRVTRHRFVRLELRPGVGVVPIYQCELSAKTRSYGCLDPRHTRRAFEEFYGPLQLDSWPGCARAWIPREPTPAAAAVADERAAA